MASSSSSDADARDPLLFCPTQMPDCKISPALADCSPSILNPDADDLTADWTQWMRWDAFDAADEISNHVDLPDYKPPKASPTAATTAFGSAADLAAFSSTSSPDCKPVFTFQGHLTPPQTCVALKDPNCDTMEFPQPSFSPAFAFDSQQMPAFAPPLALDVQLEHSPPCHAASNFPPTPVSAGPGRKRKSSEADNVPDRSSGGSMSPPAARSLPAKKRSHNVIEKRYRANLNEKIAELRDSVPCLRVVYKQRFGGGVGLDDEDDEKMISSTNKLNKASILSKATEYIKHLEMRNKRLDEENIALKNRLRQLEKSQEQGLTAFPMTMNTASPGECTMSSESVASSPPSVFSHNPEFSPEGSPNPLYPAEGLIKVPEYFKRLRPSGPQPHYADSFAPRQAGQRYEYSAPETTVRRGGIANKFMLGTLAGLMVVGTFETQKEDASNRGLLGVPVQLLSTTLGYVRDYVYMIRTGSWQIRALSHFAMTSLFVVGCAFFVYLYLFYSRPSLPKSALQKFQAVAAGATEFRRDAWLTSIQTVGVPSHNFFPEWFAVTSRCLEYCLRCLLGWKLYSILTGISEDDEKGRVKAWDIALDAQLTGGDAEVSKSRLVLTIFAAGTLPRSLSRMMLKALHCRILLWRVGSGGSLACRISDHVARILANYQWRLAQQMQKTIPRDHEDALPSHLAYLLEHDCDEVFTDAIVQRASNMIWNRPTQEATDDEDLLMDVVVEDSAVRSPLDAVAAWWSSHVLQEALIHSLDVISVDCGVRRREAFERHLEMALKSAPPTSAAYTRAAAVKALFFDTDRVANINSVLLALPRPKREQPAGATIFLDSSVPPSARDEICIAVRCAMIAAILRGQVGNEDSSSSDLSINNAIELFNRLPIDAVELTLLGFASLYHLLHIVSMDERLIASSSLASSICSDSELSSADEPDSAAGETTRLPLPDFARIASGLVYWVKNAYNPISSGFTDCLVDKVVSGCVEACRHAGVDTDEVQLLETNHADFEQIDTVSMCSSLAGKQQQQLEQVVTAEEENEMKRPRRASVRSDDTGYGSLNLDES
ncbi:Clr6 histone deacetylase associated PHD protein-2 Cph2 [Ophidiomyces ophidiicola]|nr:Clr6 histone deacetylase associated PHD protein-2 Cph2 [Ophidiomyces ophidiicola]